MKHEIRRLKAGGLSPPRRSIFNSSPRGGGGGSGGGGGGGDGDDSGDGFEQLKEEKSSLADENEQLKQENTGLKTTVRTACCSLA
jgi:hypothetical protein|eukprot:COSAG06_NODE_13532_length_1247_cov_1799.058362_1_plen_85_part_00